MTEYDFSPEAYERHIATQHRIASWVERTEAHRPQFGNALKVPPSVGSVVPDDSPGPKRRPSNRRHRSSDTLRAYVTTHAYEHAHEHAHECTHEHNHVPSAMTRRPPNRRHRSSDTLRTYTSTSSIPRVDAVYIPRSQPHSRSSSRLRRLKHETAPTTILVSIPPTSTQTYVYTPPGWVPAQGLVIIPPGTDLNVIVPRSSPTPPPQQTYQPTAPMTHVPQSIYPSSAYSRPVHAPGPAATSNLYPPPRVHPGTPYMKGVPYPPPPPTQVPGPTPLRPEMFGAGGPAEVPRRPKTLGRSASEVWIRR